MPFKDCNLALQSNNSVSMAAASAVPVRHRIASGVLAPKLEKDAVCFYGPHIGSEFTPPRLYGGEIIYQAFAAFHTYYPAEAISSVSCKYLVPGNCEEPIYCTVERTADMSHVLIKQGQKSIAIATIRSSSSIYELPCPQRLQNVKPPETFPADQSFMKNMGDGRKLDVDALLDATLFDLRIISLKKTKMLIWCRLLPDIEQFLGKHNRPTASLLLTDIFIVQVVAAFYAKFKVSLVMSATLNHNIRFLKPAVLIDPFEFHLLEVSLDAMTSNRALMSATLYSRNFVPEISIAQESFIGLKGRTPKQKL